MVPITEFDYKNQQDREDNPAPFDVYFEKPAMIKANTKYRILFSIDAESTYLGIWLYIDNPASKNWQVTSNGTEFFLTLCEVQSLNYCTSPEFGVCRLGSVCI